MTNYLLRHLQVFLYCIGQLAHTPFSSLLGIAVLGVALALPSGLYVLVSNAKLASHQWQGRPQISLFLHLETTDAQTQDLVRRIEANSDVSGVDFIPAATALEEFKELSGFGDALDALGGNPLPSVLLVHPTDDSSHPGALQQLMDELARDQVVELAQLDFEWVQRLHAMIKLAQRGVVLLAALLGLAVVVVISNTIRLAISNRRDEIEIISLIGGTEAFVERPFLYAGLLQGMLGALVAWLLISLALWLMSEPIAELAMLYGSRFELQGLGYGPTLILIGVAASLGWVASRITVRRHLHRLYSP